MEGFELEVLKGIDFKNFKFNYILVECIQNFEDIKNFLKNKNYLFLKKLSHIDYLFTIDE